jgi:hypothetical protein
VLTGVYGGGAKVDTNEIIHILRAVLRISPEHPFALHLFLHAVEASSHPEQAKLEANKLRDLAPGIEHLLHMPSHIDIRCGRWHQAIEANNKAIAAEDAYEASVPKLEFVLGRCTTTMSSRTRP